MKVLTFVFVKIPRKIIRVFFYKLEFYYYRFLRRRKMLQVNAARSRYLVCIEKDIDNIVDTYCGLFPGMVEGKVSEADLICEHVFDALGSGPKKLSRDGDGYQPIDWHSDFKSDYRWNPKAFYADIKFGEIESVDVKVPWELSRFQHLNILGQVYILTKDKKYAEEFKNQISDWISNNPVCFGVNWRCTMDVAIRAANWLVAMEYFVDEDLFSQDFLNKFYTSVYEHGKFIRGHLEYRSGFTSNHYLADITGLLFIAVYCPFFKDSRKWQEFAVRELSKEIEKQVYSDGCNFEASTSYHRLVLEMLFYCQLLCQRAGLRISTEFEAKLKKMFEFSLYCIKPNGLVPQVGDNDSGRFLIFAKRPVLEHKYLLTLAAVYYKDSSFKLQNFNFDEEAFWVFGTAGKRAYDELPSRTEPLASKSFPDAGWFIIHHNNDYCFISCGPTGQGGKGGHAHNDKLSFELMLNGRDIIVDPGTYVYTPCPNERNKFRSTEYHNTVKIDDYEQNEIPLHSMFALPDRVKIRNAILRESQDETKFEGEIEYIGITHRRMVILNKELGSWQIKDSASCVKPINVKPMFHLSPDVYFRGGCILSKGAEEKIASIEIEGHGLEKGEYEYSPEYGVKMKAEHLEAFISFMDKTQTINTYIKRAS
jgi:hypothetical protein